eukprot:11208900-Lingulodinium_polyedra.AAC.1
MPACTRMLCSSTPGLGVEGNQRLTIANVPGSMCTGAARTHAVRTCTVGLPTPGRKNSSK